MKLLKYIKKQLQNRTDSEHKQAALRLFIVFTSAVYCAFLAFVRHESVWSFIAVTSSFVVSLGIFVHIVRNPEPSPMRRCIGAIQDNFFTTLFLYFAGLSGALYLFVYPFITVGNGFRFGVKYLAFSGTLGIICLSLLIFVNPAWQADMTVGYGILLSNILVTLYTGLLLRKLQQTQTQLEDLATHDTLTGLPNRACFMQKLETTVKSNNEEKHGIVCIYFDLDGFKTVNDIYGHKVGDMLLKSVATNVQKAVRTTDLFARLGGDEFTLLLDSRTTLEDTFMLCQRIIRTIESITELQGKRVTVSCSIGIAYLASSSDICLMHPEELLKIADEAMYKAKKTGKGRYELASVDPLVTMSHPTRVA